MALVNMASDRKSDIHPDSPVNFLRELACAGVFFKKCVKKTIRRQSQ
jgi:hypothetical protein